MVIVSVMMIILIIIITIIIVWLLEKLENITWWTKELLQGESRNKGPTVDWQRSAK